MIFPRSPLHVRVVVNICRFLDYLTTGSLGGSGSLAITQNHLPVFASPQELPVSDLSKGEVQILFVTVPLRKVRAESPHELPAVTPKAANSIGIADYTAEMVITFTLD